MSNHQAPDLAVELVRCTVDKSRDKHANRLKRRVAMDACEEATTDQHNQDRVSAEDLRTSHIYR